MGFPLCWNPTHWLLKGTSGRSMRLTSGGERIQYAAFSYPQNGSEGNKTARAGLLQGRFCPKTYSKQGKKHV